MEIQRLSSFLGLLFLASISSCTSKNIIDKSGFDGVRTIELRDNTNTVLLASTEAGKVRDYIEIGLKGRGYQVCTKCDHDAKAVLTIHTYKTQEGKGLHRGRMTSYSEWTLTITRDGKQIYSRRRDHKSATPITELSARQVQDIVAEIPATIR